MNGPYARQTSAAGETGRHRNAHLIQGLLFLLAALLLSAATAEARPRAWVKAATIRAENPRRAEEWLVLPFAFSTDSMGFTAGVGGIAKGYGQEQLIVGGAAWASADDAVGGVLGLWDYRLPRTERLFFTTVGSAGYYPRKRAYTFPFTPPGAVRPGSNDSDEDAYVESGGVDNWFDLQLEYVLPIGAARDSGAAEYRLMGGLLQSGATGGQAWNPLKSGITNLMIRQFNRYQDYETDFGTFDRTIHALEMAIYYNNTDFPTNPSYGSTQYLAVKRDFAWLDSDQTWTFVEFEASKYYALPPTDWARQRVLAANVWVGDTPSWEEGLDAAGNTVVTDRPPYYEGARLGGLYRMRAYPQYRFNGRSVVYATAEYRYTPHWNPLGNISWLRFLKTDWWQFVGFVEGGRVADEFSASELLSDWKVDAGLAVRALMAGTVVRLDVGFSDEGVGVWVMAGHPF
jgi:hypothetical protein